MTLLPLTLRMGWMCERVHVCMCARVIQGFMEEVLFKYDSYGVLARKLFIEFQHCFELLPLATLVNDEVLVLHGGLPRRGDATLADIAAVSHRRVIPCGRGTGTAEDTLFEDIMWSDPSVRAARRRCRCSSCGALAQLCSLPGVSTGRTGHFALDPQRRCHVWSRHYKVVCRSERTTVDHSVP